MSLIDLDFGKRFSVIILYIHNSMYEKVASLFWSKACATRLSENLWYHKIMYVVFCKTILQILPSRNQDSAFSLVVVIVHAAFSGTYTKTLVMTKCNFEKFQVFVVLFDLSNYKNIFADLNDEFDADIFGVNYYIINSNPDTFDNTDEE